MKTTLTQGRGYTLTGKNRKVWDTHTGECLHTIQHPHIVRAVAFPCQVQPQLLATGGFDKKLMIYELTRSSGTNTVTGDSNHSSPQSPNFNLHQQQLPQRNISSPQQQNQGHEIGPGTHKGAIKSVVWSSDLNVLVTASEDRYVRWFDIRARQAIAAHELSGPIGSCELNASMSTLSVAAGKTVSFFSGTTPNQLVKSFTLPAETASVAVHDGEGKFVTGGNGDTWVRVWDLNSTEPKELDVWKGHHGPIWSLGFSPDGKLCASGSEDGTVKLWKFCEGPYGLWR